MLGEEANELRYLLNTEYPIENGIVKNWTDMEYIFDYTFGKEKLNIDPKQSKV